MAREHALQTAEVPRPGTAASNLREFGMSLIARTKALKRQLARRAMGL